MQMIRHISANRRTTLIVPLCVALLLTVILTVSQWQSVQAGPPSSVPDGTLRRLRVPILMYHYISSPPASADKIRVDLSVSAENFRQQMQWLKDKGYTTITPDDLYSALMAGTRLPNRPILLTFDDGYADAYTNAFPILKSFGFTGTFFVVTGFIDSGAPDYLTWAQAKEMANGGMYIQSHSRTHKDMRRRDEAWLADQIIVPRDRIKANIGIEPRFFCYPSGEYDDAVIQELRSTGFVAGFTTSDGTYSYTDDMMRLPRVRIRGSTTIAQFDHLLAWKR